MPALQEQVIRVDGLRDLQRAFAVADKTLDKELRTALKEAAEPVRADAESLAVSQIQTIGVPWSRMKVGVTRRSVYVAPRQRGTRDARRRRPNLAGLLLGKAMIPALDKNIDDVEHAVDDVLAMVGKAWERA